MAKITAHILIFIFFAGFISAQFFASYSAQLWPFLEYDMFARRRGDLREHIDIAFNATFRKGSEMITRPLEDSDMRPLDFNRMRKIVLTFQSEGALPIASAGIKKILAKNFAESQKQDLSGTPICFQIFKIFRTINETDFTEGPVTRAELIGGADF
jgi:hypothetical protein